MSERSPVRRLLRRPVRPAGERSALWRVVGDTRARWPRLALSIALGAGAVLAAVALLAVSGYLISRAAEQPPILALTVAIAAVRALSLARALLRYAERVVSHDLAFRVLADLRVRFFRRLAPKVPGDLPLRAGDVLSRFVSDVDALQHVYVRGLGPPFIAVVAGGAAVLAAGLLLPAAGVALALSLAVAAVAPPLLTAAVARAGARRQGPARAELTVQLLELARGGPELAVAGREADWIARAGRADAALVRCQRRDALAGGLATGLGDLLATGAVVAVVAVSLPAVHAGTLSGVALAALALLAYASLEAVVPLAGAARHLDASAGAAARLEEVTAGRPSVRDPARPRPLPRDGDLEVSHVRVRLEPGGPWVLDDVSLRLGAGRRVAVVGPSGAGKTTLARLLVRFRDPDAGAVTLGGVDLRALAQADVRRTVRLAGQDAHLFTGSIRANLAMARPEARASEMEAALAAVGLGDWLETLPRGLDAPVGESGAEVSGGQRRRIAAARVLLADARFLIFDEPAAHLDALGRERLLRALVAGAGERGLLVVTHALEGLDAFDEVLVVEGGRIVERGPDALLRAAGGRYASLAAERAS